MHSNFQHLLSILPRFLSRLSQNFQIQLHRIESQPLINRPSVFNKLSAAIHIIIQRPVIQSRQSFHRVVRPNVQPIAILPTKEFVTSIRSVRDNDSFAENCSSRPPKSIHFARRARVDDPSSNFFLIRIGGSAITTSIRAGNQSEIRSSFDVRSVPDGVEHHRNERNEIEATADDDIVRLLRALGLGDRHLQRRRHHHVQTGMTESADENALHPRLPHSVSENLNTVSTARDQRGDVAVFRDGAVDALLHSRDADDVAFQNRIGLLCPSLHVPRGGEEIRVEGVDKILEDGKSSEMKAANEAGHASGDPGTRELTHLHLISGRNFFPLRRIWFRRLLLIFEAEHLCQLIVEARTAMADTTASEGPVQTMLIHVVVFSRVRDERSHVRRVARKVGEAKRRLHFCRERNS